MAECRFYVYLKNKNMPVNFIMAARAQVGFNIAQIASRRSCT